MKPRILPESWIRVTGTGQELIPPARFPDLRKFALEIRNAIREGREIRLPGIDFGELEKQLNLFKGQGAEGESIFDYAVSIAGDDRGGQLFNNADLRRAKISSQYRYNSLSFDRANLQGAEIRDLEGNSLHFHDADLSEARISKLNAHTIMFHGADLQGAKLSEITTAQAPNAGISFGSAKLQGASLSMINSLGANFMDVEHNENTNIEGCNFGDRVLRSEGCTLNLG